jgi:hypothetical protein
MSPARQRVTLRQMRRDEPIKFSIAVLRILINPETFWTDVGGRRNRRDVWQLKSERPPKQWSDASTDSEFHRLAEMPAREKEIPAARKADGVKRENDESSIRGFPPFLKV